MVSLHWEYGVSATGPLGKYPSFHIFEMGIRILWLLGLREIACEASMIRMVFRVLAGYWALSHTQVTPAFQKFSLHYFTFVKELLKPVSLIERNLKRSFAFMKKKQTMSVAFRVCFAGSHARGIAYPWEQEGPQPAPSQRATLSLSAASHHDCQVCEHLCCILIHFFHLLARCVLR